MKFIENKKGQGALEYLLIIGAALIVAITVIVLVISMSSSNRERTVEQDEGVTQIFDNTIMSPLVNVLECEDNYIRISVTSTDPNVFEYAYTSNEVSTLTDFTLGEDGTATITQSVDSETGRHSVQVSAIKNGKYSRPSTPATTCKPQ